MEIRKVNNLKIKVKENVSTWVCTCGRINNPKNNTCICGFNAYLGKGIKDFDDIYKRNI